MPIDATSPDLATPDSHRKQPKVLLARSASFDGTVSPVIVLPHQPSYAIANGTVTMVIRPASSSGSRGLFSKDAYGFATGGHLTISLENADVVVRLQDEQTSHTVRAPSVAKAKTPLHLVVTFGHAGLKLYVSRAPAASAPYTGGINTNEEQVVIGADNRMSAAKSADTLKDFFAGSIKLTLYDAALTAAEVAALPLSDVETTPDAGVSISDGPTVADGGPPDIPSAPRPPLTFDQKMIDDAASIHVPTQPAAYSKPPANYGKNGPCMLFLTIVGHYDGTTKSSSGVNIRDRAVQHIKAALAPAVAVKVVVA
jgi:hypothetical protein